LKLIGNENQIVTAINSFPSNYHRDFIIVRDNSRKYTSVPNPGTSITTPLAKDLRDVLKKWGSDQRRAPKPRGVKEFENTLTDPLFHSMLLDVLETKISQIGVLGKNRYVDKQKPGFDRLNFIDSKLIYILNYLAGKLFIDNTNVTYPMKALLLLAAYMPAFDSNVRAGLKRGGFAGFSSTRLVLPKRIGNADSKKITSLPFLLGECWSSYKNIFIKGVSKSNYPNLIDEPARIFDILLFMQSDNTLPVLLEQYSSNNKWYDLQ